MAVAATALLVLPACKKERVPPPTAEQPPIVEPIPTAPPVATPGATATAESAPPSAAPSASSPASRTGTSIERARAAALDGNYDEIRRLLGPRVRTGQGNVEEARLLKQACKALGDRACVEDIKAKYPERP